MIGVIVNFLNSFILFLSRVMSAMGLSIWTFVHPLHLDT